MTPMAALGPTARALIESGRSAYRPQGHDRARIGEALRARLGPEALPPHAPAAPLPAASGWSILGGTILGVCLGASVALWALQPGHAPQLTAAASRVAPSIAAAAPIPAAPVREVAQPPAAAALIAAKPLRTAAPPARRDPLSQEVVLLSRATRAIGTGQFNKALSALSEHEERFPNGKLSEERRAANAQALCALGRVSEGRAAQAQLAPQSPAAARAKQACDAAARAASRPQTQ